MSSKPHITWYSASLLSPFRVQFKAISQLSYGNQQNTFKSTFNDYWLTKSNFTGYYQMHSGKLAEWTDLLTGPSLSHTVNPCLNRTRIIGVSSLMWSDGSFEQRFIIILHVLLYMAAMVATLINLPIFFRSWDIECVNNYGNFQL